MNIPDEHVHDVIEDLSAVYLSGEALPGTRAVVEQYAKHNAELAQRLKLAQAPLLHETRPGARDQAAKALQQTRQFIGLRTMFTATGIAFTLLPFSLIGGENGVRFLFWPEHTGVIWAFWGIAAASWVARWLMNREVRKAGL